ncbi:MAG: InlB B-repeat-containing protein [Acholeplasmataceae bacterium]|jgi:uncharacterized repeat protein (TIGR02543 family)|nr:InlB B-repeat-containing protein [Acholeplasmataceae bacterium]
MHAIKSFFKFSLFLLALFLLVSCDEGEIIPEEVIYTITFDSNSGSEVLEITEMLGTSINKPSDPTRMGYTFRGWYFDEELTELVTWPFMITSDLTLYAKWSEESVEVTTYDITFDTMGGSVINPLNVEEGTIISKPLNPTKDGYLFVNWYLEDTYTNIANFPITVTSNLTLYAKWEESNSNEVSFSYYELSEANIAKIIHSGLDKYYGDSSYFLTSDGKLLFKESIFNQLTNERDQIYVELPFSLTGSLANQKIIDAIIYEPVVLFKIESGRWFGIEIGEYATGDYLGVANEFVSIDLMLGLDFNETIVQINKAERFFYAFTSKNRVFVAGTLELDYEPIYTFNEPLEITDEFVLDQDEHFIPNDLLFEAVGENQIALRTNKRIFVPRELVVSATGDSSLSLENSYFIDINDIDSQTYHDGVFLYRKSQVSLQLLSDNDVLLYQYYDGEHQTNTYNFVLNPDETVFVLGVYFMTNQNRMFSIDEFYEMPIDDQVTDFLVAYSSREDSMFGLYPLFKTDTNKYYIASDGIDNMIDITDKVLDYTLVNGFWIKDQQAYIYDVELDQKV